MELCVHNNPEDKIFIKTVKQRVYNRYKATNQCVEVVV
jgi:hypothetical protein